MCSLKGLFLRFYEQKLFNFLYAKLRKIRKPIRLLFVEKKIIFFANSLIRESYAFFRKSYAFIRESFAFIRESYALIREKYDFFLYENEHNRVSYKNSLIPSGVLFSKDIFKFGIIFTVLTLNFHLEDKINKT